MSWADRAEGELRSLGQMPTSDTSWVLAQGLLALTSAVLAVGEALEGLGDTVAQQAEELSNAVSLLKEDE